MKKGPVFLGRAHIYWCEECNVPLISEKCDIHGKETVFRLNLTPPADVRFAFKEDVEFIKREFGEHYGIDLSEIIDDRVVLMNKTPGEDDVYEIVLDGYIFGWLRFEPRELKWKPGLKVEGAMALWKHFGREMKKWVIVDQGAKEPIKKGANVLPVGVIEADESIKIGDDVIVVAEDGEVIATGIAKKDYKDLTNPKERRTGIKTRHQKHVSYHEGKKATIDDVLRANRSALEVRVKEARRFIRKTVENTNKPPAVAFSGGKDSLAVLGLVMEELEKFSIFFNNTGIEFPETLEYVEEIREELEARGIEFIKADAGDAFWRAVNVFSPPGRDYRWCCKVTKLGPITLSIKEHYPDGVLMFVGQRKYESIQRARQPRVWRNPWVPNEVGASPIFHWNALDVWLYIFSRNLKYNPLYEHRLDRIGCFMCPSSSLAELQILKEEKPELWSRWERELERWRKRFRLPEEWITHGFWRWKRIPRGQRELARDLELEVEIPEKRVWEPLQYRIEGNKISFNTRVNLRRIKEVAPILGEVEEGEGYIKAGTVVFSEDGATAPRREDALQAYYLLKRAYECVGCGVCVGKCPENALSINPKNRKIVVNYSLCTHCGECMDVCPLLKIKNPEEGSQL
ncbi:MAG: phosphoadenosine phosphosulfate reductase family protein [Palaeococcus sp.]|uniref:phosphoadenosine phosphosulfate reductase domain-containing protein n=1 Tax=Palaeococcus sp. (in: euryarchaeotes) TaxID=2820298 RepID=UPI0025E20704|nr:phosphoadenosine phosphosulfate reductase family protein [Palaeococcus sp. (in: euryarchaeotes)]MCD6559944.1 phosphoadenosine phosphosulfate reductase family protein [Palaeococcus sp. (in: euryarchaeotes)]